MTLLCINCNKVFTSTYNYDRHINRKTPCNMLLQCVRCDKIFKYQREFDTHTNRKFPCKMTPDNIMREEHEKDRKLQIQLSEEKNKVLLAIADEKIKIANEKNKIKKIQETNNIDKIANREKEIEARETNLKLKIQFDINLQQAKSESRELLLKLKIQYDTDSRQAKAESRLVIVQESERLKLERKKNTASVINTNILKINISIYTDSIKLKYAKSKLCFSNTHLFIEKMFNDLCVEDKETRKLRFLYFFHHSTNTPKLVQDIIERNFKNPEYPKARNIFYNYNDKKYYVMYINDGEKRVDEIDYETKLREMFTNTIRIYFVEIKKYELELSVNIDNFIRFKEMSISNLSETIKCATQRVLEYTPQP